MNRIEYLNESYNTLRSKGLVHTKKEFAELVGVSQPQMSKAMAGDERNLSKPLMDKVQNLMDKLEMESMFPSIADTKPSQRTPTLPVIPIDAMAGTLGDFTAQIQDYDCERIISPIAGADYAIKVFGESMSPEYPSGSLILIKKIQEEQFISWGNTFCLDTDNGAVIKNIYPTKDPDVVECRSINPSFPPFTIKTEFINGWYRVLMVMSQK